MKKSNPLFVAIAKSGKRFIGSENYFKPNWKEIPDEETIDKVFYRLPDNNYLTLHNYEKYLYLVEGTKDANGKNRGILKIRNLYFMALRNGIVDSYRISIFRNKQDRYKIGDLTKRQYKWEDIKNKYTGWK